MTFFIPNFLFCSLLQTITLGNFFPVNFILPICFYFALRQTIPLGIFFLVTLFLLFLAVPRQLYRWPCLSLLDIVEKHYHTALWETCDPWDMWWEWWGEMTWPTKRQWQRQWQWQRHLENTLKEWSQRLMNFETFDQRDEETWPKHQKDNDNDNDNDN